MSSHDLKRAKRAVRREILGRRDALEPAERARRGRAAVERFLQLPELDFARIVMGFWSFGSEVPTELLLRRLHERGARIALPRIVGGALQPRSYVAGDPLEATTFGALEPVDGEIVDPGQIDVIAVPAVAFDRSGARIGYGGGFYDRLLASTRSDAARLGIAFDVQVVDGWLPAGAFDQRVDAIVTESETIRCDRARSGRRST